MLSSSEDKFRIQSTKYMERYARICFVLICLSSSDSKQARIDVHVKKFKVLLKVMKSVKFVALLFSG